MLYVCVQCLLWVFSDIHNYLHSHEGPDVKLPHQCYCITTTTTNAAPTTPATDVTTTTIIATITSAMTISSVR